LLDQLGVSGIRQGYIYDDYVITFSPPMTPQLVAAQLLRLPMVEGVTTQRLVRPMTGF
jgi:hypothetical protein